jgi:hypothetical protein
LNYKIAVYWAASAVTHFVVVNLPLPCCLIVFIGLPTYLLPFCCFTRSAFAGKTLEQINALFERRAESRRAAGTKPKPLSAREWERSKEEPHA